MLLPGFGVFSTLTTHPRAENSLWKEACALTEIWFRLSFFGQRQMPVKKYSLSIRMYSKNTKSAVRNFFSYSVFKSMISYLLSPKSVLIKPLTDYHQFSSWVTFFLILWLSCTKCTYFPWGNWDEREALRHCTWWWAGESHLCSSCRALCRLCFETWLCQSLTGRTPWWPTQATGAHGPGTTMMGLQKNRRKERWSLLTP